MQTHVAWKHPHGCFDMNVSSVVGCNHQLCCLCTQLRVCTISLLLPYYCPAIPVGAKRFWPDIFIFWFSCGCVRRGWLQSIEQSIRWINFILTDELFNLFFALLLLFSMFFFFFSHPLSLFFFILFPDTWSQSPQARCLLHELTLMIIHCRFSVLIVAHPVFWACSSARNSRNKGFLFQVFPPGWRSSLFPCRNCRWHPRGCSTPETQRGKWAMGKTQFE